MVCIAAFIILLIVSLSLPILRIFNRELSQKIWKMLKKAWGCVGKKLTLRKCDTNFKEDVKNTLLARVVVAKPRLVKPISVGIEVVSVLIVVIFAWSVIELVKSGLSLVALGTCNVESPESCSLGAESCAIDGGKLNWFEEWGEIFAVLPTRFKNWSATEYADKVEVALLNPRNAGQDFAGSVDFAKNAALDIFDPGCIVCKKSYNAQLADGFFDRHSVYLLPYPIVAADGEYKFANSEIISRYILASDGEMAWEIVDRLFTGFSENGRDWQDVFNTSLSREEAGVTLQSWLSDFGLSSGEIAVVTERADSAEITMKMSVIKDVVDNDIRTRKIPTMIFDGKIHFGLYK
ncbi:MAG: hypothetical protein LBM97_00735 [Candidatus Nomurabacteria bacterium]|jgi:hypothetical protein|nr:hypothetical protein [Candidatus Nomurabacteria bacterium]